MYKRDVAVLILSFLALFLCLQHEGSFSFRKAWCVLSAATVTPTAVAAAGHLTWGTLAVALLCRYHATLHDPSKLEVLQDRLEDLPLPVVVRAACEAWAAATHMPQQPTHATAAAHMPADRRSRAPYSCVLVLQADLNGDGHLEVIIATHDYQLQVGVFVCV